MHIQSYQIHNVLNAYRRHLSQTKPGQAPSPDSQHTKSDTVSISEEGKNQSIMEKVADNVLKKITNVGPESNFEQEMARQVQSSEDKHTLAEKENAFVFDTILENNQKETRSIAVDDSQVLMNRLNELAKAAVTGKRNELGQER